VHSRRGRALFLLVLIAGIGAVTAVWAYSSGRSTGSTPAFGGGYVEGVIGAPARINPLFAGQNETDAALVSLIFAGLTRLDDKGQPFPDLAETWSLSQDGRTYTFVLRQGLLWQDGAPLTSDDVVFTYGLLKAPGLRAPPAQARVLADASVTRVDARTVAIELAQPYAPLPAYLTLGILPAHLLKATSQGALFDAPFNQQPVGAGPYRLERLEPDRASLIASPSHHLGQPFIQHLDLRFYRDEGALLEALRTRQIHGGLFRSPLSASDRVYLETRKDLRTTTLVTGETTFVYLNLKQPPFQDRRVRQALLNALDRDGLIKEFFAGQALKPDSPLPIDGWGYTASLSRYQYDPSLANLLLDEAGWRAGDGGVRVRSGVPLAFTLATTSDPVRVALAQGIARLWEAIGVKVTVEAGGTTVLVRDLLEPRSYQAALFSSFAEQDPDPYGAWHSSQGTGKGANLGSWSDDRVDRLLIEARGNLSQARRKELYAQFQELFAQEVPAVPVYASSAVYVQSASIQGSRNRLVTNPGDRFWQVHEWHLKTR
jgi:peptide/nickel transport system substrate-binding protein